MTGANDNDRGQIIHLNGPGESGDEPEGVLRIRRRSYRAGDFAVIVLAAIALVAVAVLAGAAAAAGTLFKGWTLPLVILAALLFVWFALIRLLNRRTVVLDREGLERRDGPVPNLAAPRKVIPRSALHGIEITESYTFTMPPTHRVARYSVLARLGPPERRRRLILFPRLYDEEEAQTIRSRLSAALGKG